MLTCFNSVKPHFYIWRHLCACLIPLRNAHTISWIPIKQWFKKLSLKTLFSPSFLAKGSGDCTWALVELPCFTSAYHIQERKRKQVRKVNTVPWQCIKMHAGMTSLNNYTHEQISFTMPPICTCTCTVYVYVYVTLLAILTSMKGIINQN